MNLLKGIKPSDESQALIEKAQKGLRKSSDDGTELRRVCVEIPEMPIGRLTVDTLHSIFHHCCLETLLSFRLVSRACSSLAAPYMREKGVISLRYNEINQPHLKEKINFAQKLTGISLVIPLDALLLFDNILQLKGELHNTVSPLLLTVQITTLEQWEEQKDNLFKWKDHIRKLDLQGITIDNDTEFEFILNQLKNFPNLNVLYLGILNFSGDLDLYIQSHTNINKISIYHISSNIKFIYPDDVPIFFYIKDIDPNAMFEDLDCSESGFFIKQIQGCYYVSNKLLNPLEIVIGKIDSHATINLPEKFGSMIKRSDLLDVANTHNCHLSCDEGEKKHCFKGVITTAKFVQKKSKKEESTCCNLWGYTSNMIWIKVSICSILISLLAVFCWDMWRRNQSDTPQPSSPPFP